MFNFFFVSWVISYLERSPVFRRRETSFSPKRKVLLTCVEPKDWEDVWSTLCWSHGSCCVNFPSDWRLKVSLSSFVDQCLSKILNKGEAGGNWLSAKWLLCILFGGLIIKIHNFLAIYQQVPITVASQPAGLITFWSQHLYMLWSAFVLNSMLCPNTDCILIPGVNGVLVLASFVFWPHKNTKLGILSVFCMNATLLCTKYSTVQNTDIYGALHDNETWK